MTGLLIKVVVNAAAIWVAAAIVPGVVVAGDDTASTVASLLIVGAIFGLVNTVIKPIVSLLALPALVVTLGLFTFVINALMLQLTSWLSGQLELPWLVFTIEDFFWSAILAAIVVSVVSFALNLVLSDD